MPRNSFEALSREAILPASHAGLGLAGLPHDFDSVDAIGALIRMISAQKSSPSRKFCRSSVVDEEHSALVGGLLCDALRSCIRAAGAGDQSKRR
ncbi:hypothetical protein [Mesorhizobium sp. J8]|uniref:hypothetical protein n=1 Tax=Mesorhizobium sp. J8 TaxID=2777475 RepID=UPI001915CECD|nr:hypothetical protein [Mesorhizobium sp. J8]